MTPLRHLKEIGRLLTLTCEEVAALVSESFDRELPRSLRLAVGLHQVYCVACRRYRRQVAFLGRAMARLLADLEAEGTAPAPTLPPDVRDRIKRALREG